MEKVIAIDGPSASGKSTLAKNLAEKLHIPYINTGSMFRATALAAQKRNIAWDDEKALAEAIDGGIIGGAALDVYTTEPPLVDSPIMNIKNRERIVYTPHTAWSSVEARKRCISMTADNIAAFIKGESQNDVWS